MSTNNNPHMLVTSVATGRPALAVLEAFIVDTTLPKHAAAVATQATNSWLVGTSSNVLTWGVTQSPSAPPTFTFANWFRRICAAVWTKGANTYARATAVPVEEVFEAILGRGRKLECLTGRLSVHRSAIKDARSMGQTALAEELEARSAVVETEAVLFAAGYKGYIQEETLIDFAQKCERGLRLDWVQNFTRLIPHSVRVLKTKMDALQVFDNYVLLHYDPDSKGRALTSAEVAKKRDPILFGVIKGSRRLYHVASWKDEYCDLTFGDLIDKYGEEALTL